MLLAPSAALADGLLVGAPNPYWVIQSFGLTGAMVLWLLLAGAIAASVLRLTWKRAPGERSKLVLAALVLPAGLSVLLVEFLLWGLLDAKLGFTLTGVIGLLLGMVTTAIGLPLIVRSTASDLAGADAAGGRVALWVLLESLNLVCVNALLTIAPEESSALAVLVYVMGQALALRLAAVERESFSATGAGEIYGEIASRIFRHNVALVVLVYVAGVGLKGFPEASAQLLLWLLALRVLQPLVIWAVTAGRRFWLPEKLEPSEEQDLLGWISAAAVLLLVFVGAFLFFRTSWPDGTMIDADFWWAISAVVVVGLIARLTLDGGRRWMLGRLAQSKQDKDEVHATVHQVRGLEAIVVLLALVSAVALFDLNSLIVLVSLGPMFLGWVLALAMLAFGYCLGDGLTAPSDEETPQSAPRYEFESLALVALGLFLIGFKLDSGVTTFGLLRPDVVIGAVLGVALHGFLFPLSIGMPKADLANNPRDRTVYRVRQVHSFLALFFLHAGLGWGLPLFSVPGFVAALLVMTTMDFLIAPGKALEERFNTPAWLLFGLVGTAIAIEMGKAIEENGVEIFSLLPIIGPWIGDVFGVDWVRHAIGIVIVLVSVLIGMQLRRRGMTYRLPESTGNAE